MLVVKSDLGYHGTGPVTLVLISASLATDFPFTWLANSSTSIFVMYSPGTTTKPRYRLVISRVTEAFPADDFGGGGSRYSKAWARTILRS